MQVSRYIIGFAVLVTLVGLSIFAPKATSTGITWSSPKFGTVTAIVKNTATGHVSYVFTEDENSGISGSITTVNGCGFLVGSGILYQDSSIGTRRIFVDSRFPSDCQVIPNEY